MRTGERSIMREEKVAVGRGLTCTGVKEDYQCAGKGESVECDSVGQGVGRVRKSCGRVERCR